MKKEYKAPVTESYKLAAENLICVSGGGAISISSGGSSSSGSVTSSDAKVRDEMEDAIDDLMDW
ncbi:MAG: hypothetical protein IKN44_07365 [Bacteroidaceae bacterium]|nr:hypothetical protein [Bacteroidaceae bacterium]